jgi:hypothetical protein
MLTLISGQITLTTCSHRDSQAPGTNSVLQTAAMLQTKWFLSLMHTTVEATQIMETTIRWVLLVTKQRLLSDCLTIKQLYKINLQLTIHKYWVKHLQIVSVQLMAQQMMPEKLSLSKDIFMNLRYVLIFYSTLRFILFQPVYLTNIT